MNLYVLFAIFWFIYFLLILIFVFHIDMVYKCIVLRCIVEINLLLTYLQPHGDAIIAIN